MDSWLRNGGDAETVSFDTLNEPIFLDESITLHQLIPPPVNNQRTNAHISNVRAVHRVTHHAKVVEIRTGDNHGEKPPNRVVNHFLRYNTLQHEM